jgi:proteasome lid subunit RPN8/RPN11
MAGFFWKLKDFLSHLPKQPNNYIAGCDGRVYSVRDSQLGRLVLRAQHISTLDDIQEGFQFSLPKIPGDMLSTVLSFFRTYCREEFKKEVMVRMVYDTQEKNYLFDCPEQTVTYDHVHAPDVGKDFPEPRYLDILHIHSHNEMPAEFSEIDDANERKYRLYVVVGRLNREIPEITVRVGSSGGYIYLPVNYIFDQPNLTNTKAAYPVDWHDRVTVI